MTPTEYLTRDIDEYREVSAYDALGILHLSADARCLAAKRLPIIARHITERLARIGNSELTDAVNLFVTRCQEHVQALLDLKTDTTVTAANIASARAEIDTIIAAMEA